MHLCRLSRSRDQRKTFMESFLNIEFLGLRAVTPRQGHSSTDV